MSLAAGFSGCATVSRQGAAAYNISGQTYFSLVSLCDLKKINWDYDPLTRTADLGRDGRRIRLQNGGKLIFVDGNFRRLSQPVDVYRGMLVVPGQFRQILEEIFPEHVSRPQVLSFYKIRKVIIDPGHGGKDPGTPGRNGVPEKEIVLDIAKRLSRLLKESGVETVLTRSTDKFIVLEKRAELTGNSKADLFISIHANANKARSLNGFEIYCLSPEISDYKRALSSARKSSLNPESGSWPNAGANLKAILWDMKYNYNRGESRQLSRAICRSVAGAVDARIIGVKEKNLCVLRESAIPAILVEVGFVSNVKEERALNDPAYRQNIAEGIRLGIREYACGTMARQPEKQEINFAKSKEER